MVPHAQNEHLLSQATLEAVQQAEKAAMQARTAAGPQASLSGSSKRKLPPSLCAPAFPKRRLGAPESADRNAETPEHKPPGRILPRSLSNRPTEDTSVLHYVGRHLYLHSAAEIEAQCRALLVAPPTAFGFDIEWRVTYRAGERPRKAALIQLCYRLTSGEACCLLAQVWHSGITPALLELLESESLLKAGVGSHGDALKLERDFAVQCKGTVCLSEHANARLCGPGSRTLPQKWSLAGLAWHLFRVTVRKDDAVRCGNWEQLPLTAVQQKYAATDAYAALKLYEALEAMPLTEAAAPAPACDPCKALTQEQAVPAAAELQPLQTSKLAVWKLWMEQGRSVVAIAQHRHIQPDTVKAYIADAIMTGQAYRWHELGITDAQCTSVQQQVVAVMQGMVAETAQVKQPQAGLLTKVAHDAALLRATIRQLVAQHARLKELKANIDAHLETPMGYGCIRLALAHLLRSCCDEQLAVCASRWPQCVMEAAPVIPGQET